MVKLKPKLGLGKANYCSHCGAKLSGGTKFCPSCGRLIGDQLTPKLRKLILPMLSVLITGFILASIANGNISSSSLLIVELGLTGLFFWAAYLIYKRAKRLFTTKSKIEIGVATTCVAITIILIGFAAAGLYYGHRLRMAKYQNIISNYLVDADAAKTAGDQTITAGGSLSEINQFEKTVVKGLNNITPPRSMTSYHSAAAAWVQNLADADSASKWKQVNTTPDKFQLKVTTASKHYLLRQVLDQLGDIKAFGDAAVARNDIASLLFIEGRLTAQQYFLDGLSGEKTTCIPTSKGTQSKTICSDQLSKLIKSMRHGLDSDISANNSNAADWAGSSASLAAALEKAGFTVGKTITGTAEQDKDQTVAETVDKFWTSCKAKNGSALKASVKKAVSTIDGGNNCYYTSHGDACWAMLTNSGREFSGGGVSCKTLNLLASTPSADNFSFDGTYTIHSTGAYCSTANPRDFASSTDKLIVKNNRVDNTGGYGQIELNNSGDGGLIYNTGDGSQISLNLHFDQLDSVQGAWNLTGPNDICSGSFAGTRH